MRHCQAHLLCLLAAGVVHGATNLAVRTHGASLAAMLQAAYLEAAASNMAGRADALPPREPAGVEPPGAADAMPLPGSASRAEWLRWQRQLPGMPLSARRGSYDVALQQYQRARQAFWDAFTSGHLQAMSLAYSDSELALAQLRSLFPADDAPVDVPRVPEPDDMRRAYRGALHSYRTNWLAGLQCTTEQAAALRRILSARSLADHTAVLDHVSSGAWPSVSMSWISHVYQDLTWQEPYVFAYWYGRGNARALLGDMPGANRVWRLALRFFPETLYVRYHLARTCGSGADDQRRALRHFEWITSATRDPRWRAKAYCHMAQRQLDLGEYDAAATHAGLAAAEAAIIPDELAPWQIQARRLQSAALLRNGQPDQAVQALERAVLAFPRDAALKRAVAECLFGLATAGGTNTDYAAQALAWYEKILKEDGAHADILARKAHAHLLCGHVQDARNAAVQELALDPGSVNALTVLGFTYLADGDTATAGVFFRKALDIDATYPAALHGLATIEQPPAPQR